MNRILVIGYGNELRGDDGLGPKLASAIDELRLPGVKVVVTHQLTPELSDPISRAEYVVFIDASMDAAQGVQVRPLEPTTIGGLPAIAHAADPSALLALARELFGFAPPGWLITIPAADMGFGDSLSKAAQSGLEAGLAAFKQLRNTLSTARNRPLESIRHG